MDATLLNYFCLCVCMWAVKVPPVVFQCRLQNLEFFQLHPSVELFKLSFSSGVPVYLANIRWISSGIPLYFGSTNGIPVAFQCSLDQLHWLRVREWAQIYHMILRHQLHFVKSLDNYSQCCPVCFLNHDGSFLGTFSYVITSGKSLWCHQIQNNIVLGNAA